MQTDRTRWSTTRTYRARTSRPTCRCRRPCTSKTNNTNRSGNGYWRTPWTETSVRWVNDDNHKHTAAAVRGGLGVGGLIFPQHWKYIPPPNSRISKSYHLRGGSFANVKLHTTNTAPKIIYYPTPMDHRLLRFLRDVIIIFGSVPKGVVLVLTPPPAPSHSSNRTKNNHIWCKPLTVKILQWP